MDRDNKGRFVVGNKIGLAGGRPLGSIGSLNKEMLQRVNQRGLLENQHIDVLLMDIAFDENINIDVRLKAASKMSDILFTKNAAMLTEEPTEKKTPAELESRIIELLGRVNLN